MKTRSGGKSKTKEKQSPLISDGGIKRQRAEPSKKKKVPPKSAKSPSKQSSLTPQTLEVEIIPPKRALPPTARKKPGTLDRKTQKALDLAINHGVEPKDAYTLVNGKNPTPATLTRFKQKVSKFSLQAPGMVKLAHQAVKDVLEGKEVRTEAVKIFSNGKKVQYQEVMVPTHTNRLAAAAMIYDRTDPLVRRSESLNVNVDCSPVDLSKYRNR